MKNLKLATTLALLLATPLSGIADDDHSNLNPSVLAENHSTFLFLKTMSLNSCEPMPECEFTDERVIFSIDPNLPHQENQTEENGSN